jgi:hypothetical protein
MESDMKPIAVVWTAPGKEPPPELMGALSRGGLHVQSVSSPYLALAHLCHAERARPQDSKTAAAALVVVDPALLSTPGHVCEAASRYAPHAKAWTYASGSNQRLRAVVQEDVDTWMKAPGGIEAKPVILSQPDPEARNPGIHQTDRGSGALNKGSPSFRTDGAEGPKLRLTGEVQPGAETADPVEAGQGQEPPRPKQVLSSEELEMLLGDGEPTQ